jgi:molybdate transport system regulatory protein
MKVNLWLNSAAAELSMSYRAVWCRVRESEDQIGRKLILGERKGSILTSFANDLMTHFYDLNVKLQKEADNISGSLLYM